MQGGAWWEQDAGRVGPVMGEVSPATRGETKSLRPLREMMSPSAPGARLASSHSPHVPLCHTLPYTEAQRGCATYLRLLSPQEAEPGLGSRCHGP